MATERPRKRAAKRGAAHGSSRAPRARAASAPLDLGPALVAAFLTGERINQVLARELGSPIQDQFRLWEWHKRQREIAGG